MKWVLLISLGPVQDFIFTARKCQDLWYGSWLLSELARATAQSLESQLGATAMVFPNFEASDALGAEEAPREVVNKVLVELTGSAEHVREVAEQARGAMMRKLASCRDEVFERVGERDPKRHVLFKEKEARAQVDELIEFFWVAVPIAADGYHIARGEAERLLAARKNTLAWTQPSWCAAVPKSSLDGVRESVLDECVYDELLPGARLRLYGTDRGERLSGIDLLKRVGFDTLFQLQPEANRHRRDWHFRRARWRFASTQHLASLPWMTQVNTAAANKRAICEAWKNFRDLLDAQAPLVLERYSVAPLLDGAWLFQDTDGTVLQENGLASAIDECVGDAQKQGVKRMAEAARRTFFDAVGQHTVRRSPTDLQPYYAVLLADGDRMGAVIDHAKRIEEHQAISRDLARFAASVGGIVRDHDGSLVYSGGDDVLALLPIHKALACAAALHEAFGTAMSNHKDEGGASPSLSAGLVFAHQKTPLAETLMTARQAEKAAKAVAGKDALAFWVDKRGGERVELSGRFADIVDDLQRLVGYHRAGTLPGGAAYELEALAALRVDPFPDANEAKKKVAEAQMADVQKAEITRVLRRRWQRGGNEKMPDEVVTWLDQRASAMNLVGQDPALELSRRMRVAEAIARGEEEAGMPLLAESTVAGAQGASA